MLEARAGWYRQLLDLLRVRARTLDDIVRQAAPYFPGAISYDPDAVARQWKDRDATVALLAALRERLGAPQHWDVATLEEGLRALAEVRGVSGGKLFQPLRVALTGLTVSPGIFEVLELMGRDLALSRLDHAIGYLRLAGKTEA